MPKVEEKPIELPSPEIAFTHGQNARKGGLPKFLNPYRKTERGPDWDRGWDALQSPVNP